MSKKKRSLSKIRKSAKLQECQVRIPGVCNFDETTTIPAHKNGAGMALKSSDSQLAYCCSSCHDVVDHRVKIKEFTYDEILIMFYEGIFRTQLLLIEQGLIVIKN